MGSYKLREKGLKEIRNKMLLRAIPSLIIAAAVGIYISTINSNNNAVNVFPYVFPMIVASLASLGIGAYLGSKRQKALLESYILTFNDNKIVREQFNTPVISILFENIQEIAKNKNGSFTIKGKEKEDIIGIPVQIENYHSLENELEKIQPIVVKRSTPFLEKYQSLSGLVSAGLMLCVYTANNKIIVGLTGSAFIALMSWSFIRIRSNKNIDNKSKKIIWWFWLIVASVIVVMYFKLFAVVNNINR